MDRMPRESQKQERTVDGAKPSFILLESIRCQIDMAVSPWPAGLQQLHTPPTGRLACFIFCEPAKAIIIITKSPSTASRLV